MFGLALPSTGAAACYRCDEGTLRWYCTLDSFGAPECYTPDGGGCIELGESCGGTSGLLIDGAVPASTAKFALAEEGALANSKVGLVTAEPGRVQLRRNCDGAIVARTYSAAVSESLRSQARTITL